jgi:nucleotide-binding universal stress UspA family protein
MTGKRILVPVTFGHAALDALSFVQGLSGEVPVEATFLHVVNLNVCLPERRVHDEICHEHESRLYRMVRPVFHDDQMPRLRVRIGKPHEEILAEARSEMSGLIIMVSPATSWKRRWFHSATVDHVVRNSSCPVLVLPRVWSTRWWS